MARPNNARAMRYGAVTLVLMVLLVAATFNLSKFPGFAGTSYSAEFSDASGIHRGNIVQISGIRVGRVTGVELEGTKVVVDFEVDPGVELGPDTAASIRVLNLLGEKYLELTPAGEGDLAAGATIPLDRTSAAYDIVRVFGTLTATTEEIDTESLVEALDVIGDTAEVAAPEVEPSIRGVSRLSRTIASRDEALQALLVSAREVTDVLDRRAGDLTALMGDASLVFDELQKRRDAVHRLLVTARELARELRGVAEDNRAQIGPALRQLKGVTDQLERKRGQLKDALSKLGPYANILGNIIGSGPWFDAYIVNLYATFSGEFEPVEADS